METKVKFSRDVTLFCKGIAVLMLLFCHLFVRHNVDAYPIWVSAVARRMGLCVPVFLVLSGYGLGKSEKNSMRDILTYRLPKLLINYWFVALPFIVIAIVFCDFHVHDAYPVGKEWHFLLQMLGLDVLGIGVNGFNPTWWFMNAIVSLYLFFPLLYWGVCRSVLLTLLLVITTANVPILSAAHCVVPFTVGIIAARFNLFERVVWRLPHWKVVVGALIVCVLGMIFMTNHHDGGGFGAFAVMALFVIHSHLPKILRVSVEYLGRHSMNIFLSHTLFLKFLFADYFSGRVNPFLALVSFILLSLAFSIVLEQLKKMTRISCLLEHLAN